MPTFLTGVQMPFRPGRTLALVALAFLPVACGEEIQGDVELASATEFPVWLYSDVGPTGVTFPGLGIRGMGFGGPMLMATSGAEPRTAEQILLDRVATLPAGEFAAAVLSSPSCLPDLFGDGVDTDADGIPDDRTATYTVANCTVYDTANGDAYIVRGVYRIRDTNDDRYGFRLDITDLSVRTFEGAENSHQSVHYNVTETSRLTATAGTYHLIVDGYGAGASVGGTYGYSRRIRYDITQTFTPALPVPVGGPLTDGTMAMSGNVDITAASETGAGRVKLTLVTTQPLIYDDGCGGIASGGFEMRLNGGASEGIHVAYYLCAGDYEPIGAGVL